MSVTLLRSRLMSNFASALIFWLSSFNVNIKNKAFIKLNHVLCRMIIEIHTTLYLPVVYSLFAPALFSFSESEIYKKVKNWI